MKVLALNGSPHKNGTVAKLMHLVTDSLGEEIVIDWFDTYELEMQNCIGCMKCRKEGFCVLHKDDAHLIAKKINEADILLIGTPVHWGNMSVPLKLIFDRNVSVLMKESSKGIPMPRQKHKKAILVAACSAPWPVNFIFSESRGALRSIKKILKTAGYKIVACLVKPGTRESTKISKRISQKAVKIAEKLKKS